MINIETAKALLARVEACDPKGDRELDLDLWNTLTGERWEWCAPSEWLQIGKYEIARLEHEAVRQAEAVGDIEFAHWLRQHGETETRMCAPARLTTSLDAASGFIARRLPHFWLTSGLCAHSGHASIGPDYNGPKGETLKAEWPKDLFHEGFHADLRPGDGQPRQCLALLHCLVQAEIARAEMRSAP